MMFLELFRKALKIIDSAGIPDHAWGFGGGTALYEFWKCPRISKDIDIFLYDIQLVPFVSPRTNSFAEEICGGRFVEQSNFVKLELSSGDIDFIAAPLLTSDPIVKCELMFYGGRTINVERPWEIVGKKLFYRSYYYKERDIVDLVSVLCLFEDNIPEDFLKILHYRWDHIALRWDVLSQYFVDRFSQLKLNRERWKEIFNVEPDAEFVAKSFEKFIADLKSFQ
ncbi:MAG: nucleotidyl transferase AbiEii/AbiGii toxin family protein [Thermodesulforhabdaceae bacterium]